MDSKSNLIQRALVFFGAVIVIGFVVFQTLRREVPDLPPLGIDRSGLTNSNGQLFVLGETNAFTGVMTETYPDGAQKSRSEIVQGQLHGKSEGFYPNGQRQIEEHFNLGISEGIRTRWLTNGVMQSEGKIVQGEFHGEYRKWHENGQLAEFIHFENGTPHGIAKAWFPSGFLKSQVEMDRGETKKQETWDDGEKLEENQPVP